MQTKLFIPVVLGTARTGRYSEHVAQFIERELRAREGITTELFDVRGHLRLETLPPWGEGGTESVTTPWREVAEHADGFVLVVPEYNRGYPGELKILLDSLYDEYRDKAVGMCGVSDGPMGGARVVEHIKPVLIELGMWPIRSALLCSFVDKAFNEKGELLNADYRTRTNGFLDDLIAHVRLLHAGRSALTEVRML